MPHSSELLIRRFVLTLLILPFVPTGCATRAPEDAPKTTTVGAPPVAPQTALGAAIDPAHEIEAIRTTLHRYAMFLDDGRVDDFLDLFTPDAVFTADEFTYAGREAIRSELAEKPRGPGKHLPFPALIELDSPTTAHAWSDFLRVKIEREGDPTSWVITSLGRYYDELVKGEDGRWRFRRRDVFILAMKNRTGLREPVAGAR